MKDRAVPAWERRFRAPVSYLPEWSPMAPDRLVYASNEAGGRRVVAWDGATGQRGKGQDHWVGATEGRRTLAGRGGLWLLGEAGDESVRWMVPPFRGGEARPFLDGVPHGWNEGMAQALGVVAAAVSDGDGFAIHVSLDGGTAKEIARSPD